MAKKIFLFLFFPLILLAEKLPNVAIVITGGTIVEQTDPQTGSSVPVKSAEDLLQAIPGLKKYAHLTFVPFSNLDSSQMNPSIWAELSKVVNQLLKKQDGADGRPLDGYDGVVVVHGTDTMVEGAFFLDLTLTENKPVVFVGAMKNASDRYSDGPPNLIDAVSQVVSDKATDWGVTVTLNNYIHSARFAEKVESTNVQAFGSGDKGILGYIINQKVYRVNNRSYKQTLPLPETLPKVELVQDFSGSDGSFIRYAADNGAEGIVVSGFGSGNVNEDVYHAIEYAIKKGVAVVITTNVPEGGVFPMYGDVGGGDMLKKAGAIVTGDLTAAKARLLLMLTLPLVKSDHSKLEDYFSTY